MSQTPPAPSRISSLRPCPYCGAGTGQPHRADCALSECRRRGWFAVRAPHGLPGYVPCPRDTPGATEDLNRWAVYRATGEDRCYRA